MTSESLESFRQANVRHILSPDLGTDYFSSKAFWTSLILCWWLCSKVEPFSLELSCRIFEIALKAVFSLKVYASVGLVWSPFPHLCNAAWFQEFTYLCKSFDQLDVWLLLKTSQICIPLYTTTRQIDMKEGCLGQGECCKAWGYGNLYFSGPTAIGEKQCLFVFFSVAELLEENNHRLTQTAFAGLGEWKQWQYRGILLIYSNSVYGMVGELILALKGTHGLLWSTV